MSANSINDTARVVETLSDEELLAWLRLAFVFRGRAREAVQLVAAFGLPETIFELPRATVKDRIGREAASELFSAEAEAAAEKALAWLRRTPTADVVLVTDPFYPKELIASGTSDVLLFIRGRRETLVRPRVTLLISAKADAEGRRNLKDFAAALAENGVTAVLAGETEAELEGITAASQTPGGVIIAATAGPDRVPSALCLAAWKKAEQTGLILTGHFPGTSAADVGYEARDYLLAAMCRGLLVVEAERRDPLLGIMRRSAELGRDAAAIPGSIHSPLYKGNHLLIRQGAKLTESLEDLMKDFGLTED